MRDREPPRDRDGELVRLMIAYQAGGLDAFTQLYAELAGELRRYFAAIVDSGAVQDLMQDTFLEIHRSRRTYLPPLPVVPWVFGIARNVLGRHRRAAWRRRRSEERAIAPGDEKRWSTGPPPPPSMALDACDFDAALRRLPAGRRRVWMLRHIHGLSFQEIGDRLRIGAAAAKLRSSRAMKTLRMALAGAPDPASGCPPAKRAGEDR